MFRQLVIVVSMAASAAAMAQSSTTPGTDTRAGSSVPADAPDARYPPQPAASADQTRPRSSSPYGEPYRITTPWADNPLRAPWQR